MTLFAPQVMSATGLNHDNEQMEGCKLYTTWDEGKCNPAHSLSSVRFVRTQRTPPQYVGAVMAILATFDHAQVLPPESSPKANQLIRSLIQFQSAFMNREIQSVQEYLSDALSTQLGPVGTDAHAKFFAAGWTSISMEALVDYSVQHPFWVRPEIRETLSRYNLSPSDWDLIVDSFTRARQQLQIAGKDVHEIFAVQRRKMPGGSNR